jgi:hypothetical protein
LCQRWDGPDKAEDADWAAFGRLLEALEPWLEHLVIVGGWAHRLYWLHDNVQPPDFKPLTTLDADVAIPANPPVREGEIRQRLLAAGFEEQRLGDSGGMVVHYPLVRHPGAFYAEFITSRTGGAHKRDGSRKQPEFVGGVAAQPLAHVDLLLESPWQVDLDDPGLIPWRGTVRIAGPVRFLAQKLLILRGRSPNDRAKDILYIHDTLQVFGRRLEQLREEWKESVAPSLLPAHRKKIQEAAERHFGVLTDAIRQAKDVARREDLTAEDLRAGCERGLRDLFG